MRRNLVVGNWKMNGSSSDASLLSMSIADELSSAGNVEVAVCIPFVYLSQLINVLDQKVLAIGAQDVSVHQSGAYTGEVSAAMLADIGCSYVIVGHSERRQYHHESNLLVGQKALAALNSNLVPIVCLGESLAEREDGQTLEVISQQLKAVQSVLSTELMKKIVIAYEPVWAIGTGLSASPEQAQEVHAYIRAQLGSSASSTPLLYGGSVKATNADVLFAQPDIDGALVGGAALDAAEFIQIVKSF